MEGGECVLSPCHCEVTPSNSEVEVAVEGTEVVSEEGVPTAITSGKPTKEVDPPKAVEAGQGSIADVPGETVDLLTGVQAPFVDKVPHQLTLPRLRLRARATRILRPPLPSPLRGELRWSRKNDPPCAPLPCFPPFSFLAL